MLSIVSDKKNQYSPCIEAVYDSEAAVNALIENLRNQVINKHWSWKTVTLLKSSERRVYKDIFMVYKVLMQVNKVATVYQLFRYRQRNGNIVQIYPTKNLIDYWDAIQRASVIARACRWF